MSSSEEISDYSYETESSSEEIVEKPKRQMKEVLVRRTKILRSVETGPFGVFKSKAKSTEVSFDFDKIKNFPPHNEWILIELYNTIRKNVEDIMANSSGDNYSEIIIVAGLTDIVKVLMESVDKYRQLSGDEKKVAVRAVLEKLLGDIEFSREARRFVNFFVKNMLDGLIDVLVDAADGNINVNKRWTKIKACCATAKVLCRC